MHNDGSAPSRGSALRCSQSAESAGAEGRGTGRGTGHPETPSTGRGPPEAAPGTSRRQGRGLRRGWGYTGRGTWWGFGCSRGDTGDLKCCGGSSSAGGGGGRQQRGSPGVCAHREHDLEVVEQLDVLGDAGAGPADHVVLAMKRVMLEAGTGTAESPPAPTAQTPQPTSVPSRGTGTGPAWLSPVTPLVTSPVPGAGRATGCPMGQGCMAGTPQRTLPLWRSPLGRDVLLPPVTPAGSCRAGQDGPPGGCHREQRDKNPAQQGQGSVLRPGTPPDDALLARVVQGHEELRLLPDVADEVADAEVEVVGGRSGPVGAVAWCSLLRALWGTRWGAQGGSALGTAPGMGGIRLWA